jgi:hypothetical protein
VNTTFRSSRLRLATASLLLATLAVRALLPMGYMPGNLLAGEFAKLCPVASAATFELLSSNTTHQHHHDESGKELPSVDSACPIGSSLFSDALIALDGFSSVELQQHELPNTIAFRSYLFPFKRTYPARAPPHS